LKIREKSNALRLEARCGDVQRRRCGAYRSFCKQQGQAEAESWKSALACSPDNAPYAACCRGGAGLRIQCSAADALQAIVLSCNAVRKWAACSHSAPVAAPATAPHRSGAGLCIQRKATAHL
jgi:hypothetical protein